MKKIIAIFVLIFLMLLPCAYAGTGLTLTGPYDDGESDNIIVRVYATEVTKFDVATFTIDYDLNALQFVSAVPGSFSPKASVVENIENGKVVVNVPGFQGISGSGIIAKLSFTPSAESSIQLEEILLGTNLGKKIEAPLISNLISYDPNADLLIEAEVDDAFVDPNGDDSDDNVPGDVEEDIVPDDDSDDDVIVDDSDDDDATDDSDDDLTESSTDDNRGTPRSSPDPTPSPSVPSNPNVPTTPAVGTPSAAPVPTSGDSGTDVSGEDTVGSQAKGEGIISKVATNPILIISLIIIVLGVGGFFTYKHFMRIKKEKSEKNDFQNKLQMPGSVSTGKKPVSAQPSVKPKPLMPLKPVAKPIPTQSAKPAPVKPVPTGDPGIDYIKSCRAQGFTEDQIKIELKKQGWSDQDILQKMVKAK